VTEASAGAGRHQGGPTLSPGGFEGRRSSVAKLGRRAKRKGLEAATPVSRCWFASNSRLALYVSLTLGRPCAVQAITTDTNNLGFICIATYYRNRFLEYLFVMTHERQAQHTQQQLLCLGLQTAIDLQLPFPVGAMLDEERNRNPLMPLI